LHTRVHPNPQVDHQPLDQGFVCFANQPTPIMPISFVSCSQLPSRRGSLLFIFTLPLHLQFIGPSTGRIHLGNHSLTRVLLGKVPAYLYFTFSTRIVLLVDTASRRCP
jgi:hypothetical protein